MGLAVYLLDRDGNSVPCSETINPATMHMTMLSTANPNSVGKYPNPHQLDAANVFLIERRMRWIPKNGGPPQIVYRLIPRQGVGRERLVHVRDLLMEVRFKPGDWVWYLKKDGLGNKTRLWASVKGSEVIKRKRFYTINVPISGLLVHLVQDADLEAHTPLPSLMGWHQG